MTEALQIRSRDRVFEVGTGSGYQAAVLVRFAALVFTVERIGELQQTAHAVLEEIGMDNVFFRVGDGSCGWPERARYDRIFLNAGVPEVLKAQLSWTVGGWWSPWEARICRNWSR
jgi:protein-L-isoaspartate(D-aspartate) O-methyltransferase